MDEVGILLGCGGVPGQNTVDLLSGGNATAWWNIQSMIWAFWIGELGAAGVDMVGASQFVGWPGTLFQPANNCAEMSLVDWRTGLGNARFWTMKMLIDGMGHDDKHILDTNVSATTNGGSGNVYARGFAAAPGTRWPGPTNQAVLLSNMNQSHKNAVTFRGLRGATFWSVEHGKSGYDDVPYAQSTAVNDVVELSPLGVALVFVQPDTKVHSRR
jgi:hypothetical protein